MKQVITRLAAALCVASLAFGASATERGQAGVDAETASVQDQSHESAQRFGTFSEWSEPVNLGPVINSGFNDWFPAISPNGLSLYISSNRQPRGFGLQDIWVSQRVSRGHPWGAPVNLGPTINSPATEWVPNFSPDGHWMFFISSRTEHSCGGTDLWVSWRPNPEDDLAWEAPMNLGCTINSEGFDGGPNYFEDRKTRLTSLYFISNRLDGLGGFDVYVSMLRRNGTFGAPALVWELSTPQNDERTAIRRDGLEMILYSDRPGVGSFDLWVSTRETTLDAWSRPVNLGPTVNSDAEDRGPALSRDGTALYYNSNRFGFGGHDLYVTTRTRLVETSEVTQ